MYMLVPTWFVVAMIVLMACNLTVDLVRFFQGRHHDHLLPRTPRRARG